MDSIGGNINAFTSKECTCYHIKVMSEKLNEAADILSDIVLHSTIAEEEIDKERSVIIEEINMTNDSPEDVAHEKLSETFFEGTSVAKTILGPAENIRRFKRKDFIAYMDKHYFPKNIVISAAGNFDEQELINTLEKYFGEYRLGEEKEMALSCIGELNAKRRFACVKKDTEQVHICISFPGFDFNDERKYALNILNNVLGGSMSSVLFQKIREERGLAYSTFSYQTSYSTTGMFSIYAGTSKEHVEEVCSIIKREIANIKQNGISEEEFEKSIEQLSGNFILSLESTSSIMNNLGKNLLLRNEIVSEDEIIKRLRAVTMEDVKNIIDIVFDDDKMTCVFVGNVENEEEYRNLFN